MLVDQTEETCDLFCNRNAEIENKVMVPLLPWVARARLLQIAVNRMSKQFPEPATCRMRSVDGTVTAAREQQAELRSCTDDLRALVADPPALPDIPVTCLCGTVISKLEGKRRSSLVEAHRTAAATLPGRHLTADRSSHYIPFTEPGLVADEILGIVGVTV